MREDETPPVEEVAHRVDDFVAHTQNRLLTLRPDPQVPAIEEIVDAVLLGSNRVVVRLADDLRSPDVDLVAARRPLIRARRARDHERRLLGETVSV